MIMHRIVSFAMVALCYSTVAFGQQGFGETQNARSGRAKHSQNPSFVEALQDLYPEAELKGVEHTWLYCDNSNSTTTKEHVFVIYSAVEGPGAVVGPDWANIPAGTTTSTFDSDRKMTKCCFFWKGPLGTWHVRCKSAPAGHYFYWASIHWKGAIDARIETVDIPLP